MMHDKKPGAIETSTKNPMSDKNLPLVIYVEDDEEDRMFVQHLWEEIGLKAELKFMESGSLAAGYFQQLAAENSPAALPRLILLDLHMPGEMDGFGLLKLIRDESRLNRVPVVIYSTSSHEADISKATRLGANAYVQKPSRIEEMMRSLETTVNFWVHCALTSAS